MTASLSGGSTSAPSPSWVPGRASLLDSDRLSGLDGLRAIAMTMVIAQHCQLLPFGWTGVWLFFVLSGFVITRSLLIEERTLGQAVPASARYGAFLRRRLLRIVPVYLLYLGVCAVVSVPTRGVVWADLGSLLSFTYNFRMIFSPADAPAPWAGIGHLWTLSVEQQFYLLYPLLFFGLPDRWRWRVAGGLVLLAPGVRCLWLQAVTAAMPHADAGLQAFSIYASTPCQADGFLLGALLARFRGVLLRDVRLPVRLCGAALVLATSFACIYVYMNHLRGDQGVALLRNIYSGILLGQGRELWGYSVVALLSCAVLLATLADMRGTRWLRAPWLNWVGRVSYGGYLFHALVLWALSSWLGESQPRPVPERLALFVMTWSIAVALASLSYRCFESPLARHFRSWAQARRGEAAIASSVRA